MGKVSCVSRHAIVNSDETEYAVQYLLLTSVLLICCCMFSLPFYLFTEGILL